MNIRTFVEQPIENNNYLVTDGNNAVLIDCSGFPGKLQSQIEETGIKLDAILLTHGHFDHICGIKNNGTPVYMNDKDIKWLDKANDYLPLCGMNEIKTPQITNSVKENDLLKFGNLEFKVIETPGHTQGGVCYLIEDKLFSGDTVFYESVGRADLDGGDYRQLIENIREKILTLPDSTIIYPGHGQQTTVKHEKEFSSINY